MVRRKSYDIERGNVTVSEAATIFFACLYIFIIIIFPAKFQKGIFHFETLT